MLMFSYPIGKIKAQSFCEPGSWAPDEAHGIWIGHQDGTEPLAQSRSAEWWLHANLITALITMQQVKKLTCIIAHTFCIFT